MADFKLHSEYEPSGDQPQAISELVAGLQKGKRDQTLLGVTGSGKTFTVANIIEQVQRPTLVIAHNKTLAAQLASEYREFFPENAVHYFVSYYDYYQPEAYVPVTDTYIEKEAQINEDIERLRHAATQALLTRNDVIVVASVSCIYGLGSPIEYEKVNLKLAKGEPMTRAALTRKLISIYFERVAGDLKPGTFRALGANVEIMPASERVIYRVDLSAGKIGAIEELDPITREISGSHEGVFIFPARQYVTPKDVQDAALKDIEAELAEQLKKLNAEGKILEAERLKRRTRQDIAMIREFGYCNGIENYSRHFDRRSSGEPPYTLLSYFPKNFLTVIDESHVTVPQIGGMYAGDRSRKLTLIEHGFRLPSAVDNRPLKFEEFEERTGQTIYTSATPAQFELERSGKPVQMVVRPTGLVDPELIVRPIISGSGNSSRGLLKGSQGIPLMNSSPEYPGQVQDFIAEAEATTKKGARTMVTVLTKKMAEDLAQFLVEKGIKARYLHSDITTIERIEILTDFRKGVFDVLVGVNLLREGLDLPEVELIGILDADKEGFLRSETSLIQTIGRAARNVNGRVLLYADQMTGSLDRAIGETNRRREIQIAYNKKHGITPQSIQKRIRDITGDIERSRKRAITELATLDANAFGGDMKKLIKDKRRQMHDAADRLDFETAALLRDEIRTLEEAAKNNMQEVKQDVPLSPLTTFQIGGIAKYFVDVRSDQDIKDAIQWAKDKGTRFVVLAGGSNVLIPDEGLDALVIHFVGNLYGFKDGALDSWAGTNLLIAIRAIGAQGYGGWEKLAGIPGTIGGAVRGNAGAFGSEIKDFVTKVRALNSQTGETREFSNDECDFSYRHSFFKDHPEWIITRAVLQLQQIDPKESAGLAEKTIHEREERHLQNVRAAGSYFMNPKAPPDVVQMFEEERGVKSRESRVPAGWLIEKAGMKGATVGGAIASLQHPNYIVNQGEASARDVRELAQQIRMAVKGQFSIILQEEASIV